MRILHILDHGLPLHSGYSFRTRAIMKAQIAAGLDVAGLTGVRHGAGLGDRDTARNEEIDGLRFFRTPAILPAPPIVAELREVNALADRLAEVVEEWQPDVLHAHSPVLNALAAQRIATRCGLPLVYEIRAFWEDAAAGNGTASEGSLRYRATRWLETRACHRADAVAVICEGLRGDLVERDIDPAKILVSPNGVDLSLFGEAPPCDPALAAELGLSDQAEVIGFIGSLYDYEGIDDLIDAMHPLVDRRPDAHLLIVGGGPMEEALKARAAASPVANRIHFVDRVPHGEVERYYGLVDILAYPRKAMRLTELVTPLKPLEAMAQRRLVAASDVGGHRELIEHDVTGTLFAPDDHHALAAALGKLLADRSDWDARRDAGRAFVERERDWATNVSRYSRLYRTLIRNEAASAMPRESQPATGTRMPGRKLLRRLSAAPLETPLAVAVGGALGFALTAMPRPLFDRLVGASGLRALAAAADAPVAPGLRAALILLSALLAGALTWTLLSLAGGRALWPDRTAGAWKPRHADAHPDAPPRDPIFAGRDLGPPMMDIALPEPPIPPRRAAAASPEPAVELAPPPAEPEAITPETVEPEPVEPKPAEPESVEPPALPPEESEAPEELEAPEPFPHDDILELTDIYAPEDEPVTAPAIDALVERLKAGIDRRAAAGLPATPAERGDPALREALASLDRLGARRA